MAPRALLTPVASPQPSVCPAGALSGVGDKVKGKGAVVSPHPTDMAGGLLPLPPGSGTPLTGQLGILLGYKGCFLWVTAFCPKSRGTGLHSGPGQQGALCPAARQGPWQCPGLAQP